MMSTNRLLSRGRLPLVAVIAVVLSGCTVQEQNIPGLAGPSELGLGMSLTAAPEFLPRDGSSMSTITARTFDSNGKPLANQRLTLQADFGILSTTEVLTNGDGVATFLYIAPGMNENVSVASILAAPVQGTHYQNANPRVVQIRLMGPFIPDESFTFSPDEDIVPYQGVNFDALTPEEGKVRCGLACTYSWDFGDNTSRSGQGLQGVQHEFTVAGLYMVTLTVTSPSGTFSKASKLVPVGLPVPPEAIFTVNPSGPAVNDTVVFDGSNSRVGRGAQIDSYRWTGLPGGVQTGSVVSAVFTSAGEVTVTLTVTDNLGRSNSSTQTVTIVP